LLTEEQERLLYCIPQGEYYKNIINNNMPQILNIKYNDSFIKVELDTGESLMLPFNVFSLYPISAGKIVDSLLYQQLKEESDRFACKQKALNYLAVRSRSEQEVRNYLFKKGFQKDIINEILIGIKDNGYLDDYDFALRYISSKKRAKVIGQNALKRDLFKKGIDKNIIRKAIKETGADITDPDEIFELALKKLKSLENKKNRIAKLIYFLKQKGFNEDAIRSVVHRIGNEGHE
jgi:regulatory protein